ncbi:MAG: cell division protein SepF [Actinomycetota bacterium]|nr:cell division protein SepF [Actinomycetota bacterium]
MSSMWRKTLIYLGLVEEPEDDEYGPGTLPNTEPDFSAAPARDDHRRAWPRAVGPDANVRPLRSEDRSSHVRPLDGGYTRVTIVRATSFDDAAEQVGEGYRGGQAVLLDVGDVDTRTGRRLLDFVSGVIFALRGRIVPAGQRAFLLLPEGMDVPLEERRRLSDLGYHVDGAPSANA